MEKKIKYIFQDIEGNEINPDNYDVRHGYDRMLFNKGEVIDGVMICKAAYPFTKMTEEL